MGLYRIPDDFQDKLDQEFGGKLRVRWSGKLSEWHVEQKVRHMVGWPDGWDRHSDNTIRYKDGYVWIMSFKQGTRFECPTCHLTLKAPSHRTEMVSCDHCRLKGYNHQHLAGHWNMDETLIEHLKMLRWKLDHPDDMNKLDAALKIQQMRQVLDPTIEGIADRYNQGMGIVSVGYTGKVFSGPAA